MKSGLKTTLIAAAASLLTSGIAFMVGRNTGTKKELPIAPPPPKPKEKTREEIAAEHMDEHKLLEDVYGNIKPKKKFF